jgi:serine/threonine-protein kinase
MSPEQVRSPKTVDQRTDIWSLGVVMYELLTNSMPFGGDEINETFAQVLEKEPQPIRQLVTGVPEGLERVVMKCLAKNRDNRFSDVAELARALVAFGSGTWMQSADRVAATIARGLEEASSGPRLKPGPASTGELDRMAIPSSPGRRLDSMQPELTGTASTVARGFTVLGSRGRNLLALSVVIGVAAIVLIAGTAFQRSRAAAAALAAEAPLTSVAASADAPPEATGVPVPGANGIVTAPVHLVGPDSEGFVGNVQNGVQTPSPTLIGASPSGTAAAPVAPVPASGAAPRLRPPTGTVRPATAPVAPATTTKKSPTTTPGKPLLPPGLPRERQ